MSLRRKQSLFAVKIAELILWAADNGLEVTLGDAYRDPRLHGEMGERMAYGHRSSNHKLRLALDLNLFIDGEYQPSTVAHLPLGQQWEKMGGKWGGRFRSPDGNHYEFQ